MLANHKERGKETSYEQEKDREDKHVGRHNVRPLATIGQVEVTFKGMNGKRLKYRDLIAWSGFSHFDSC